MTLRDELTNDPLGIGYAAMSNEEVESSLNAKTRTKKVHMEVGNGTILEVLGIAAGNALLDVIYSDANFRHVKPLVEQGRLSLDSTLVQMTLDSLVPAVLTQAQADKLKNLCVQPCSRAEELGIVVNDFEIRVARA